MNARVLNHINGRLSLRPPQAESLARLVRALEAAPEMLGHERDLSAVLSSLKADFPKAEKIRLHKIWQKSTGQPVKQVKRQSLKMR
jgi:hypothetical protein